jgi:hypothetical protein
MDKLGQLIVLNQTGIFLQVKVDPKIAYTEGLQVNFSKASCFLTPDIL